MNRELLEKFGSVADIWSTTWEQRFGSGMQFRQYTRHDVALMSLIPYLIDRFSLQPPENLFNGLTVCVVGGLEAEAFAALGAQKAIGIDPALVRLPSHQRPNLIELPKKYDTELADEIGVVDVTFQRRLLDRGSGVGGIYDEARLARMIFDLMINHTRPGGLSIHFGNYVMGFITDHNRMNPTAPLRFRTVHLDQDPSLLNPEHNFIVIEK